MLIRHTSKFQMNLSVPLVLEYESVAKRFLGQTSLTTQNVDDIIDFLCQKGNQWKIYYLWRPFLKDPKDDMVLELAVTSESDFIITFNKKDFTGVEQFGISVMTPQEFLREIGEWP